MWYIMHHNGVSNFKAAYSVMRGFITCAPHKILFRWSNKKNEMDGARSTYGGWREKVHTGFCWGNLTEGAPLVYLEKDGKIRLKWIFKKCDGEAWTG